MNRIELHEKLVEILGSRNVYFQPPENLKLNYPCIIYERSNIGNIDANNNVYLQNYTYKIVAVYKDPDSKIPQDLSKQVRCRFVRHYATNGLNHDIFSYDAPNN